MSFSATFRSIDLAEVRHPVSAGPLLSGGVPGPADPAVAASVYCDGGLDALLSGAIAPFRSRVQEEFPEERWSVWVVRYSRGGQHLKVRVHGPPVGAPRARVLLADAVEAHLATLPPAAQVPRTTRPSAPAIDPEDEVEAEYPDRTLLWTRYRRSHVTFGGGPLLADDHFAALFAATLAAATGEVLSVLRPDAAGIYPEAVRQRTLFRLLIGALAASGLSEAERAAYLRYHRDWLLRFAAPDAGKEAALRACFQQRADAAAPILARLRSAASARWESGATPPEGEEWEGAVERLVGYVARFRGDPAYRIDPFAPDPVFPALFKVLHGTANQLGLAVPDEALLHDLLDRATAPDAALAMPMGA